MDKGKIVRVTHSPGAAKEGVRAYLIQGPHMVDWTTEGIVRVEWIRDDLSGHQQDGDYYAKDFDLFPEQQGTYDITYGKSKGSIKLGDLWINVIDPEEKL